MNREDIIRLAREAGFADGVVDIVGLAGFAIFAALVRADEREECAKVCDVLAVDPEYASQITKLAAMAIRARR
jgi:hypothetical protein